MSIRYWLHFFHSTNIIGIAECVNENDTHIPPELKKIKNE
ncbi:MAG: hypothetical protein JETT_1997 [Candidatus Jettenia ecosi]|uniref:Uncharacterized protein n=1 Tax=Candidatus Jettenia ecosi TaxID=2494326 RepID=A0A533QAU0_9BACT|nr:MAG: hypothetical protein JETT_1997 [Candidatus Jettenia ecosi]